MAQQRGRRILEVRIRQETDTDPDLSFLGEYTSKPGRPECTIDREARGDQGRNEFQYFVAANSGEETGNPESVEQDYQRMEAYNRGDWHMVGVWAEARVQLTDQGAVQTIRSGGLWCIESDSEDGYLDEVEREELTALERELAGAGFSPMEINAAMKDVKRKEG